MTDNHDILIERDPIDGCVARIYGGASDQNRLGNIMNEAQLYVATSESGDIRLQTAFHNLRTAKTEIGIDLDIAEPNF